MINKHRVELWCQGLESGDYKKCTNVLKKSNDIPGIDPVTREIIYTRATFNCALGVGVEVAIKNGVCLEKNWFLTHTTFPDIVRDWYGFLTSNPRIPLEIFDDYLGHNVPAYDVAVANDMGADFWSIAQAIRAKYLKDEG